MSMKKQGKGLGMSKAPDFDRIQQNNKRFKVSKQGAGIARTITREGLKLAKKTLLGGEVKSSNKVIAVHFAPDSIFDTSAKRLAYIRRMNLEPMKRVHKTPTGWHKYRIAVAKTNKKHYTIVRSGGVNIILEKTT